MRLRNVSSACNCFPDPHILLSEYGKNEKEIVMYLLALSGLLFQAIATVALILGVAADAFIPGRRARG
jgi:hypothetical protein